MTDGREAVERFAAMLEARFREIAETFHALVEHCEKPTIRDEVGRQRGQAVRDALDGAADAVKLAREQFLAETAPKVPT